MDLYNLGPVTWWESQCFYHALAHLGREGLIICYPTTPYVCLGLHNDLEQEIDQDYCQQQRIPLMRRETGGGVVYLDHRQVFFQLVLNRDNPVLPWRRQRFYKRFLRPAVMVYRHLGLPAVINAADIAVGGRKCTGSAAGDIGPGVAFVGNLLLDFDFNTMCQVLKVPSEEFRSHLLQAMRGHMTTLSDWGRSRLSYAELAAALIDGFSEQWGGFTPGSLDDELVDEAGRLYQQLTAEEWLGLAGARAKERRIKIAEGVFLVHQVLESGDEAAVLVKNGQKHQVRTYPHGYAPCHGSMEHSRTVSGRK
jgi:lipoate-protein ligase A